MKIGDLEIKGHVILGPMAGVTTLAYREFMKPFGVALSYSEMVSDCGLVYENKKTYEYLATSEVDRPVGIQLFGFDAEKTCRAIEICEKEAEYDVLDINLGCPVFKVTKTGAGSAWLKKPNDLYYYMKKICETSHKPVTAKIRLGWDEKNINVFEVAKGLELAGVKAITIHCRTSKQGYSGVADYKAIAGLKKRSAFRSSSRAISSPWRRRLRRWRSPTPMPSWSLEAAWEILILSLRLTITLRRGKSFLRQTY
jgi:nifR3 family TIM-barrel protein